MLQQELIESPNKSVEELFEPFIRKQGKSYNKVYEVIKTVVALLVLFPIRIVLLLLSACLAYAIAKIATWNFYVKSSEDPVFQAIVPKWRMALLKMLRPLVRVTLFSLGIAWIETKKVTWDDLPRIGEQTPPKKSNYAKAYVIVANHLGYIDIILLACKYGGAFVSKQEIKTTPIVGVIADALQTLYVAKGKSLSEKLISRVKQTYVCHGNEDHQRVHGKDEMCGACFSNLVIFPEGTTTNGESMVKFRTGIFLAGVPIQPIAIKLPYKHFSLTWEAIWFREHLFRTMTQFINHAEIIELPMYTPSEKEIDQPSIFAKNVQTLIASVLDQKVYPLNRKHKAVYHQWLLRKVNTEEAIQKADEISSNDQTLATV